MVLVTVWVIGFNLRLMITSSCRGLQRKCRGYKMRSRYKSEIGKIKAIKNLESHSLFRPNYTIEEAVKLEK